MKRNLKRNKKPFKVKKCDCCNKPAVWDYMPGKESYCDDCVPRGCYCEEIILLNQEEKESFEKEIKEDENYGKHYFYVIQKDINSEKSVYTKDGETYINVCATKWIDLTSRILNKDIGNIISTTKEPIKLVSLDEKGREFPCCEYWNNEDLYLEDKNLYNIKISKRYKKR